MVSPLTPIWSAVPVKTRETSEGETPNWLAISFCVVIVVAGIEMPAGRQNVKLIRVSMLFALVLVSVRRLHDSSF